MPALPLALALLVAAVPAQGGGPARTGAGVVAPALAFVPPAPDPARRLVDDGFHPRELAGAGAGVVLGDLAVAATGYATLQLFAHGAIQPNADNFRHVAYALGVTALVLPPLLSTLGSNWLKPGGRGSLGRAVLLGIAAQVAAGLVGYAAAPNYWIALPVQIVAVTVTTPLGLHWGARRAARRVPSERREAARAPAAPAAQALLSGTCPVG